MLDSSISYETPEGIQIQLPIAGPMVRSLAWFIDFLIRCVIYIMTAIALSYLGEVGQGIMLIGLFFSEWLYPTIFEVLKGGTPGKMLMGLYVTMDDGTALTWQAGLTRNLLRAVDFLPFLYITGLICTLCNRQFKRIGDLVAGSLVVYKEADKQLNSIESTHLPKALPFPFSASEQRTLLDFQDRQQDISGGRQIELANVLTPVINCENQAAVDLLNQYAAWVRGAGK